MQEGKGEIAESMEELFLSQTELAATECSSHLICCPKHPISDSGTCILTTSPKPRYLWRLQPRRMIMKNLACFCVPAKGRDLQSYTLLYLRVPLLHPKVSKQWKDEWHNPAHTPSQRPSKQRKRARPDPEQSFPVCQGWHRKSLPHQHISPKTNKFLGPVTLLPADGNCAQHTLITPL